MGGTVKPVAFYALVRVDDDEGPLSYELFAARTRAKNGCVYGRWLADDRQSAVRPERVAATYQDKATAENRLRAVRAAAKRGAALVASAQLDVAKAKMRRRAEIGNAMDGAA